MTELIALPEEPIRHIGSRRAFLRITLVGALELLATRLARGQDGYPNRPVKLVMPFAAGGGPDLLARRQAPELARVLGVPVPVENRVGAGGVVAAETVAAAAPDGYTIMVGTSSHLVNKFLNPAVAFDPLQSFAPVSLSWIGGTVLAVAQASAATTPAELVVALRAKPGAMNYASGGVGTAAHLAGAAFARALDLVAVHVPYKGSVEIERALLSGEVQFAFPIATTAIPAVQQGRLRALAVTTRQRLPQLPHVPTLIELFANELLVQEAWGGIWAPKGTPSAVVDRLFAANALSLQSDAVRRFHLDNGAQVALSASPSEFAAFMASENERWRRVLVAIGLRPG